MKKNNKVLIVIPARGNSKRLKNKNILPIKNLPMFLYVIKKIQKSKYNPRIVVSSESKKIIDLCKKNFVEYIKRPSYLSKDSTEKQEAIIHAVKYIFNKKKFKPNIVISLQVNTPQVNYKDLDKAILFFKKIFKGKKIKEVFSVNDKGIQTGAYRIMTYATVFQKTLSTKVGVCKNNYIDVHNKKEYLKVKRLIENEKN